MHLLDWLHDGFLSHGARYRHTDKSAGGKTRRQERADPSGPHHFGRRAHKPDPNARYGFGDDPGQRMLRPRRDSDLI